MSPFVCHILYILHERLMNILVMMGLQLDEHRIKIISWTLTYQPGRMEKFNPASVSLSYCTWRIRIQILLLLGP